MNTKIFREYDIRGNAADDLDNDLVLALGRAFASEVRAMRPGDVTEELRIALGRDCRVTSPRLFKAFSKGLSLSGATICDIGVTPTPLLYFAAKQGGYDGAVIITGSHNPGQDNGFKLLAGTSSLYGESIQRLLKRIKDSRYDEAFTSKVESHDYSEEYLDYCMSTLLLAPGTAGSKGRVVIDGGNGTGGPLALALYQRMGFETIPLYCEMDGRFPNHHPDPTVAANLVDLQEAVKVHKADLGIALDGDADRIGAVDGEGRILWGDQLLILFGRALLKEVPGATIIGEVKCSQALFDELELAGGTTIMSRVGHSLIKQAMKENSALLAGEMSGHIFFSHRFLGFDDGIYAGARLLELLSQSGMSLAEHYESLPTMVNTPEIRVACSDESKFQVVDAVKHRLSKNPLVKSIIDVDGVRAQIGNGWGLVRASNTQASLVLRCEAKNPDKLAEIQNLLEAEISRAQSELP